MPEYTPPAEEFSATNQLRNRVLRGKQRQRNYIEVWKSDYEAFWQPPRTHGNKSPTMAEMQAVLDADQATVQQILSDAVTVRETFETVYPEALVTQVGESEPLLPERYRTSPYERHIDASGRIVLDSLKPEWEAQ